MNHPVYTHLPYRAFSLAFALIYNIYSHIPSSSCPHATPTVLLHGLVFLPFCSLLQVWFHPNTSAYFSFHFLVPNMANGAPTEESSSSSPQSILHATSLRDPSAHSIPVSINQSDKPHRPLSFRKARKLSRVFTEFSLLDSFAVRKSGDHKAPPSTPRTGRPRPSTAHGFEHKTSQGELSTQSLAGKLSRSLSPSVTPTIVDPTATPIPATVPNDSTPSIENALHSPALPNTPPILHNKSLSPENIPLPPSRPGSSHSSALIKKRRRSLDLMQLDDHGSKTLLVARSRSLRIPSISDLSRPTFPRPSTPCPDQSSDSRDPPASPEAARHHYLEVKRARKMTQVSASIPNTQ